MEDKEIKDKAIIEAWFTRARKVKERLTSAENASETVRAHRVSIVEGVVPFGYIVSDA